MPGPQPTAEHGTDTRYGSGCRCSDCRAAHVEAARAWKFEKRYGSGAPMGLQVRASILASLHATQSVTATARELGLTHQAIYGACQAIPEFGEQVDKLTRATGAQ